MKQKILVIEDDEIIASMYQTMLVNHGYEAYIGRDGEEGVRLAFTMKPALILLDVRLPKMDGLEVMKRLRADSWGREVKICVLTNLEIDDKGLSVIVENSPSYYLIKSNNSPDDVLGKIREVLENETTA